MVYFENCSSQDRLHPMFSSSILKQGRGSGAARVRGLGCSLEWSSPSSGSGAAHLDDRDGHRRGESGEGRGEGQDRACPSALVGVRVADRGAPGLQGDGVGSAAQRVLGLAQEVRGLGGGQGQRRPGDPPGLRLSLGERRVRPRHRTGRLSKATVVPRWSPTASSNSPPCLG